MADRLTALRDVIEARGHLRLPEPVQLASGQYSRDFVDVKQALARGQDLELACRAMLDVLAEAGVEFDAVGGLTMGADQFAHGVAVLGHCDWFVVRKAAKGRGTNKRIEGASVGPGTRVVLIDDVVTTGGSIREAYEIMQDIGASVVFAITVVDRGETAKAFFGEHGVPYRPLLTYTDLNMEPVGEGA